MRFLFPIEYQGPQTWLIWDLHFPVSLSSLGVWRVEITALHVHRHGPRGEDCPKIPDLCGHGRPSLACRAPAPYLPGPFAFLAETGKWKGLGTKNILEGSFPGTMGREAGGGSWGGGFML